MLSFDTFVNEMGLSPNKIERFQPRQAKSIQRNTGLPAFTKTSKPVSDHSFGQKLGIIETPNAGIGYMLNLAIYLGLMGNVLIVDASNRFDLHYVAYGFRRFTPDWETAAERTQIVRAFTCYETANALDKVPLVPAPLLIIDLLSTFYDEAVTDVQSRRLTERSLARLHLIKQERPVILSLSPAPIDQKGRGKLVQLARESADLIYTEAPHPKAEQQLSFI